MIIAVCYDMLRISRRIMKKSDLLVGLEDFFFWVVTGIVVFSMIFQCNDGVIRGYIFLALLIGAWLYNKSVSSFIVKYLSKILNFFLTLLLKKPLKWIKMMINQIIIKPFRRGTGNIRARVRVRGVKTEHGKHNDKKEKKRKTGNVRH